MVERETRKGICPVVKSQCETKELSPKDDNYKIKSRQCKIMKDLKAMALSVPLFKMTGNIITIFRWNREIKKNVLNL